MNKLTNPQTAEATFKNFVTGVAQGVGTIADPRLARAIVFVFQQYRAQGEKDSAIANVLIGLYNEGKDSEIFNEARELGFNG